MFRKFYPLGTPKNSYLNLDRDRIHNTHQAITYSEQHQLHSGQEASQEYDQCKQKKYIKQQQPCWEQAPEEEG